MKLAIVAGEHHRIRERLAVPLLGVHDVPTTAMPKAITCVGLDISLSD